MIGMAIITKQVTYWFEIINNNVFEIRSSSNLMGRSVDEATLNVNGFDWFTIPNF